MVSGASNKLSVGRRLPRVGRTLTIRTRLLHSFEIFQSAELTRFQGKFPHVMIVSFSRVNHVLLSAIYTFNASRSRDRDNLQAMKKKLRRRFSRGKRELARKTILDNIFEQATAFSIFTPFSSAGRRNNRSRRFMYTYVSACFIV